MVEHKDAVNNACVRNMYPSLVDHRLYKGEMGSTNTIIVFVLVQVASII